MTTENSKIMRTREEMMSKPLGVRLHILYIIFFQVFLSFHCQWKACNDAVLIHFRRHPGRIFHPTHRKIRNHRSPMSGRRGRRDRQFSRSILWESSSIFFIKDNRTTKLLRFYIIMIVFLLSVLSMSPIVEAKTKDRNGSCNCIKCS